MELIICLLTIFIIGCLLVILIGFINPNLVLFSGKKRKTRVRVIKFYGLILVFLIILFFLSFIKFTRCLEGEGTKENPFVIYNFKELDKISRAQLFSDLDAYYILGADIDVSRTKEKNYNFGMGWAPIGARGYGLEFTGSFDGNGFKIKNLIINRSNISNIGLFGVIGENAVVKDIYLENVNINGNTSVGGIVGSNDRGKIINCFVEGKINGKNYVGGLVGSNYGLVIDSTTHVKVKGEEYVGDLVGDNFSLGKVTDDSSSDYN